MALTSKEFLRSSQELLTDSESSYEDKLEAALLKAGEWKAKAFKTQKAAETLKQNAQTLKERAQGALHSNKELTISLRKARQVALESRKAADELAAKSGEIRAALEQSEQQKNAALNQLSALEQQLSLYQAALTEFRDGKDSEEVLRFLISTGGDPEAERLLTDELNQCREELAHCRLELSEAQAELLSSESQREAVKEDMWANRSVFESKIAKLEESNRELEETVEELRHSKSQRISESAMKERELESQLKEALLQLKVKTKALQTAEDRLVMVESDSQVLIEELHNELESARSEIGIMSTDQLEREQELEVQINQLEDVRSDLEIVNVELYQRIAELED